MLFAALLAFVVVVEVSALADSREVFRTAPDQSGAEAILQSLDRDMLPLHCIAPVSLDPVATAGTAEEPVTC